MDSTLVAFVADNMPNLVSQNPRAALSAFAAYAFLEWVWPRLNIKGDSTPDVLFHAIKSGLRAVFTKKG